MTNVPPSGLVPTRITQLPQASSVSGSDAVLIVQNGQTKQAAVSLIPTSNLTQSVVTAASEPTLTGSRRLTATDGLQVVDGGALSTLNVKTTGTLLSIASNVNTGLITKDTVSTTITRQIVVSGDGLDIQNGDGVLGNPTLSLSDGLQSLENIAGLGIVTAVALDTYTPRVLAGTANQITITNGNGVGGDFTVSLANNLILPGQESFTVTKGTTAQRSGSPVNGMFRYNTDLGVFEGYQNGSWASQASPGITGVGTGTGLTGGPITTSGTISLANTAVTPGSYGSATEASTFTVDQQGRLTLAGSTTVTPAWGSITGTPTTLSGYGITDGVSTGGSYADPAWLTSLDWSKIASRPTTLSGYGITDAVPDTRMVTAGTGLTGGGALSGDITLSMSTVILAAGPTGGSATVPVITYNAYGQLTAVTTASVTAASVGAIADTGSNGIVARTAANVGTARTITGSTNINVVDGDGVAGNPTLSITGQIPLANGGTNANLTASNGGVIYSDASGMAVLAGTATAGQILRSGSSAAPSWSTATYPATASSAGAILRSDGTNFVETTATYPATTTINELLYSSAGNVVGGLATATTAVLTTVAGVPTWATTLNGTRGGTNNQFTEFTGPSASIKTFTLPNASDTVACLGQTQTFTRASSGAVSALTDGATITPDFAVANNFAVVPSLAGNRTLANPTNLVAGQSGIIYLPQDTTGSRTLTLQWGWPSAGVTLTTTASTIDALSYYVAVSTSSTVTVTIASPGVMTWTAHGLMNGQKLQLTTTGALPTGLAINTTYYIRYVDANSFQLSSTVGGAAINTSGAQSGTHTATAITIQASLNKAVL